MTTNNFENSSTKQQENNKVKNVAIGILSAALLGAVTFTVIDKNKTNDALQTQQTQIVKVTTEKSELQKSFDESLVRLDSVTAVTKGLEEKLTASTAEINSKKAEIRSILNKKNASAGELSRAKKLIGELNGKITSLETDIAALKEENSTLLAEKNTLTQEKETLTSNLTKTTSEKVELEKKVDVASTLNASNIRITPINIKGSGKEKVSTTAKKVDKLVISFDVDNRIAKSGSTDLFVSVIGPDGKVITTDSTTSTFTTRNDGEKIFSAKLPVEMEAAVKKNIEFGFNPGIQFQQGSYKIQIFQNGFLIGESTTELKKGGLFG